MNERSKKILKILKKSFKIRTLIFLIIVLVLNTCAWYIYISEVSSDITTHVRAWKIEFDNNISQDVNFAVDDIYPGMETVTKEIELVNKGEMSALITCNILKMRILDEEYIVDNVNITSDHLIDEISNEYPFSIKFYIDGVEAKEKVILADEVCKVVIEVSWPFDSGDDVQDTYWGNKAYDFIEKNPGIACVEVEAKIKASQVEENND